MKIANISLIDRIRLARATDEPVTPEMTSNPKLAILILERVAEKHPKEWIVFFTLCDKYGEVGRYVDALRTARTCVELRPNDIRSAYALASSYYILTNAEYSNSEEQAATLKMVADMLFQSRVLLDANLSNEELEKTGLSLQTVATQAIRWFERALMLNPDSQSRGFIEHHLSALYESYPELRR